MALEFYVLYSIDVAKLIVELYHRKSRHQGRHITGGAVRSAEFWIEGGKRLSSSILDNCVCVKNYEYWWINKTWLTCPYTALNQVPHSHMGAMMPSDFET